MSSLVLIETLPSYVTGGSVRFRVQWSEFLRADVRCGLRELIGDRTSVKPSDLFCQFIPSVALNANPCCSGFYLLQGLWGSPRFAFGLTSWRLHLIVSGILIASLAVCQYVFDRLGR